MLNQVLRKDRWYCTYCDSYLNGQDGFLESEDIIWRCQRCGAQNTITDAVRQDPNDPGVLHNDCPSCNGHLVLVNERKTQNALWFCEKCQRYHRYTRGIAIPL